MSRALIVPAAGAGSRLGGSLPKILVPVAGRPMIDRLCDLYRPFVDAVVVVAHPSFSARLRGPYTVVEQRERTGMLDAVLLGGAGLAASEPDEIWITWGDQIGLLPATLDRLAAAMASASAPAAALPTVTRSKPYIHFDRGETGAISGLRQRREGDAMPDVGESDAGLFALRRRAYAVDLPAYARAAPVGRGTGERNFLPFLPWLAAAGQTVLTVPCTDEREAIGINTPEELRLMEAWMVGREA